MKIAVIQWDGQERWHVTRGNQWGGEWLGNTKTVMDGFIDGNGYFHDSITFGDSAWARKEFLNCCFFWRALRKHWFGVSFIEERKIDYFEDGRGQVIPVMRK